AKHGKTIWFASQGTKQDWSMKRELLSPAYTVNGNPILTHLPLKTVI
ncbi:MAG: DUF4113 domain-containing protein, partial [Gammaproteobacteria bacterium]|nr:DUF4113 domain-containing protein [Gammaproteobacteria bacterium]